MIEYELNGEQMTRVVAFHRLCELVSVTKCGGSLVIGTRQLISGIAMGACGHSVKYVSFS